MRYQRIQNALLKSEELDTVLVDFIETLERFQKTVNEQQPLTMYHQHLTKLKAEFEVRSPYLVIVLPYLVSLEVREVLNFKSPM